MDQLPSENDISVHDTLDELAAVTRYFGKNLHEVEKSFRDGGLSYVEDLMWMGPKAFTYYVFAAINYLKSKYSLEDIETVSSLIAAIEFHLEVEDHKELIKPILPDLVSLAHYVLDNWRWYDPNEIHSFREVKDRYKSFIDVYSHL